MRDVWFWELSCHVALLFVRYGWNHAPDTAQIKMLFFSFFIIMIASRGADVAAVVEFIHWHWTMFPVSVKEGKRKSAGPLREAWLKLSPKWPEERQQAGQLRTYCCPEFSQGELGGDASQRRLFLCFYYLPPSRHIQNCFHMFPTVTREAASILYTLEEIQE